MFNAGLMVGPGILKLDNNLPGQLLPLVVFVVNAI